MELENCIFGGNLKVLQALVPKTEIIWERLYKTGGEKLLYLVTSDKRREHYSLWKVDSGGTKASIIGKAKNPVELHRKFKV